MYCAIFSALLGVSLCDSGSNYRVAQHGWQFWFNTGWRGCHRSWLSGPAESVRFFYSFYSICCLCYTWLQVLLPPPSRRNKYCSWCCREKLHSYRDKLALLAFFHSYSKSDCSSSKLYVFEPNISKLLVVDAFCGRQQLKWENMFAFSVTMKVTLQY